MHRVIIYALLLIIVSTGCEDIYDFPQKSGYRKNPVIEAIITNQLGQQKIRVSYAASLNDSVLSIPVPDAKVKIIDEAGDTVNFPYAENGWYTRDDFKANPTLNYTLFVQIDTTIYRATSKMVMMHGLDSVSYSYHKKVNATDFAYFPKIYAGPTDPETQRYYQIQIVKNHQTAVTDRLLLTDVSTYSLNGIELGLVYAKYDTLDISLYSLTKEMFDYHYYVLDKLLNNGGFDLNFKNNPPVQFVPKALGYFQLSEISSKSIVIH